MLNVMTFCSFKMSQRYLVKFCKSLMYIVCYLRLQIYLLLLVVHILQHFMKTIKDILSFSMPLGNVCLFGKNCILFLMIHST